MAGINWCKAPRLVISGTGSGCGKTTVACAVMGALQSRAGKVRAFKCGPDYIDPMFHQEAMGIPSRNLDSFLCTEETVRELYARNAEGGDIAVVEGVMGFYDGLGGTRITASTSHIAQILDAPVVLVCSCRGKSLSLAAELRGFQQFAPNRIAGVILNGAKEGSYPMYKEIIEEHTGLEALGYLPYIEDVSLESRHLGLVTAQEVPNLKQKLDVLAQTALETIDMEKLTKLALSSRPLPYRRREVAQIDSLRIGVAIDPAFCFYYRDNLDMLEDMGAELIFFSPVEDSLFPPEIDGLLLGGGYPELYAGQLSENVSMLESLKSAVEAGMPVLAECGGFMALCDSLTTVDGRAYSMAGVIPSAIKMTSRLGRFGYVELTAKRDNLLCGAGETVRVHSFHYSQSDPAGGCFIARKQSGASWETGFAQDTLYAGYPHLHFWGENNIAQRFLKRCETYKSHRKGRMP